MKILFLNEERNKCMKKLVSVLLLSIPVIATASNCDEISSNIAEKIKNNGVPPSQFQLKLVPTSEAQQQIDGKIVGTCDGGQQKIVYTRLDGVFTPNQTQAVESKAQPKAESASPQTEIVNPAEEQKVPTTKQEAQSPSVESTEPEQTETKSVSPQTESTKSVEQLNESSTNQETQSPVVEPDAQPEAETVPTQNQSESPKN